MSIWYHELENPDEAYVLPFFRYLVQLQQNSAKRDNEWFVANGVGGGAGMSARSVKSQDAKLSAPHYVLEAARLRQVEAERRRNQSPEQREAEERERRKNPQSLVVSQSANAAFLQAAQREKAMTARAGTNSYNSHRTGRNGGEHRQRLARDEESDLRKRTPAPPPPPPPRTPTPSSAASALLLSAPASDSSSLHTHHQVSSSRALVTDGVIENSIKVKPIPVRIPDTVIFMRRMPRAWFTYDEDAKMALRLPPLSLDTVKIFDHFSTVAPNSDGVCALYIASSPSHNGALVVEPLRPDDLKEFLGGRPSVLDRCPNGALQKYIPTNGKSNTVYEVLWTPSSCGVYPATLDSIRELPAAAIRSEKDIARSGTGGVTGLTVAMLHDQCFGMIGYFLPGLLRSERRRIIRFSGLFRVDNEQRVWFVGATCVRCAPMNEPINNAIPRIPVGLLRPAPFQAPRLQLTTPTLVVGRPPPERPPGCVHNTTEGYHPFFFTPLHLHKPFAVGTSAIDVAAAALPTDLLFSALEHEHELMHFVRETDAFLGSEPARPHPPHPPHPHPHPHAHPTQHSAGGTKSTQPGDELNGSFVGEMKYSNRGASLRFRNHTRLMHAAALKAAAEGSGGVRGAGDDSELGLTEEAMRKWHFESELKAQLKLLRAFAKRTADLVTSTLLDALSGGLSLNMKNEEWTDFVGTIVLDVNRQEWSEKLAAKEDQGVIVDALASIGCVGYDQTEMKQSVDNEQRQQPQLLLPPPPTFCFDKLEQPVMEFGPASELNLIREATDPKQHNNILIAAPPRLQESQNAKSLMAAMTRCKSRTITAEATAWLWRVQRTFEEIVEDKISEIEIVHRDRFLAKLTADLQHSSGNLEADEEWQRLHGISAGPTLLPLRQQSRDVSVPQVTSGPSSPVHSKLSASSQPSNFVAEQEMQEHPPSPTRHDHHYYADDEDFEDDSK